jgi:hypothetical protein
MLRVTTELAAITQLRPMVSSPFEHNMAAGTEQPLNPADLLSADADRDPVAPTIRSDIGRVPAYS